MDNKNISYSWCRPPGCRCLMCVSNELPNEIYEAVDEDERYLNSIYFCDPDIPGINLEVIPTSDFKETIKRLQDFLDKFDSGEFDINAEGFRVFFDQHIRQKRG